MVYKGSVLDTIIKIIQDRPNKQITVQELYQEVPRIHGKEVSKDLIRGSITRRTEGIKSCPYRIMFKRISPSTYKLID